MSALLCDPTQKSELELVNGGHQLVYIDELVTNGVRELREAHILALQSIAVRGIYPCGGTYRCPGRDVTLAGHQVPPWMAVPALVGDAVAWVNDHRHTRSAFERASYALWRLNWIHAFSGGNGRTSRAVAYLIVCMDNELVFPGRPTMPTRISDRRAEYIQALRSADASTKINGQNADEVDLSEMTTLVRTTLMQQFAAAINRLSSPGT